MNDKVIKVIFLCSQSGNCEDIFRGIDDKSKYYSRALSGRWGTSNKWSGGYERNSDIKEDVLIEIYDKKKNLLFTELSQFAKNENYPFSWEIGKELEKDLVAKYGLVGHEEWRRMVIDKQKDSHDFSREYPDNWLYCHQKSISTNILQTINYYGEDYHVIEEECLHSVCGVKWKEFYLKPNKYDDRHIVYGYKFM